MVFRDAWPTLASSRLCPNYLIKTHINYYVIRFSAAARAGPMLNCNKDWVRRQQGGGAQEPGGRPSLGGGGGGTQRRTPNLKATAVSLRSRRTGIRSFLPSEKLVEFHLLSSVFLWPEGKQEKFGDGDGEQATWVPPPPTPLAQKWNFPPPGSTPWQRGLPLGWES